MGELLVCWCGRSPAGRPVWVDWVDIGSTLVCGKPGSGKTASVACLCTQAVQQGIRLAIADPHAGQKDSLLARLAPLSQGFWRPAATSEEDCLQMVRAVHAELQRRKERARSYFAKTGHPWTAATEGDMRLLLVMDEVNRLLRRFVKEMAPLLKDLGQEGRKYEIFVILTGQHFSAEALGSTELRSAFVSAIMHRMDPKMASMITALPEASFPLARGFNRGECYIYLAGRDAPISGKVPEINEADIRWVADRMCDSPPLLRPQVEAVRATVEVSEKTRAILWGDRGRVISLLKDGNSAGDTAMMVLGRPTPTKGRVRYEATRVVEEIVRTYILELEQERVAV